MQKATAENRGGFFVQSHESCQTASSGGNLSEIPPAEVSYQRYAPSQNAESNEQVHSGAANGHIEAPLIKSYDAYLCEFSEKMVALLVETAQQALQAPGHGGLDLACCLLDDARKYDFLYFRARGVPDERLFDAAKKLREWNAVCDIDRKPT